MDVVACARLAFRMLTLQNKITIIPNSVVSGRVYILNRPVNCPVKSLAQNTVTYSFSIYSYAHIKPLNDDDKDDHQMVIGHLTIATNISKYFYFSLYICLNMRVFMYWLSNPISSWRHIKYWYMIISLHSYSIIFTTVVSKITTIIPPLNPAMCVEWEWCCSACSGGQY